MERNLSCLISLNNTLNIEKNNVKNKDSSFGVINVQITDKKLNFSSNKIKFEKGFRLPEQLLKCLRPNGTPKNDNEEESFDSKFLSKKKSVVNIVKMPLMPAHLDKSFKINKNLLQPLQLNSHLNRSGEKYQDQKTSNFLSQKVARQNSRSKSEAK